MVTPASSVGAFHPVSQCTCTCTSRCATARGGDLTNILPFPHQASRLRNDWWSVSKRAKTALIKQLFCLYAKFIMHTFALLISFILAAKGSLFPLFDWLLPNDSVVDPHQEKLDADFMKKPTSSESYVGLGSFFDDPEYPALERASSDLDDHGGGASSSYLTGTFNTNDDCEPDNDGLQISHKRHRVERLCPADQKFKNNQENPDGGKADEGTSGNEMPNSDDNSLFPLLDGIPLVDFSSINRNIGYCPEFFYGLLVIPVCASADPAYIKKILLIYYNLDHAMRGMIISYLSPCFVLFL